MPPVIVVMGVSGSGKTTIGTQLAERLALRYAEADSFHPAANVAKMSAGIPLDDADRAPWLDAIAEWIKDSCGTGGVISCSALRHRYRQRLRAACDDIWFLHLAVDKAVIAQRVAQRQGHYMPASLVDSQFAALEPLRPDEPGATVPANDQPDRVVQAALDALQHR